MHVCRRLLYALACICVLVHIHDMCNITRILSALVEPTRRQALRLIWDGQEHCVCELMAALNKGQSSMSRHMTMLKKVGLVVDRRDAQWVRYRRNPAMSKTLTNLVDSILSLENKANKK